MGPMKEISRRRLTSSRPPMSARVIVADSSGCRLLLDRRRVDSVIFRASLIQPTPHD